MTDILQRAVHGIFNLPELKNPEGTDKDRYLNAESEILAALRDNLSYTEALRVATVLLDYAAHEKSLCAHTILKQKEKPVTWKWTCKCGAAWSTYLSCEQHSGKCPNCGKTGKRVVL